MEEYSATPYSLPDALSSQKPSSFPEFSIPERFSFHIVGLLGLMKAQSPSQSQHIGFVFTSADLLIPNATERGGLQTDSQATGFKDSKASCPDQWCFWGSGKWK